MPDKRSARDRRRRELGQNFLADDRFVRDFINGLDLRPGDLVVDIGAGSGALTFPLAAAGAEVWAVERDPAWVQRLRRSLRQPDPDRDRIRVIETDLRRLRFPRTPFRVVANPPFGLTTDVLSLLLDHPEHGPDRVDLIVQREVARKHAQHPPVALRTAAWSPWWEFTHRGDVSRRVFRPEPGVDAGILTIVKRNPPILPTRLAPGFRDVIRPQWS